MPPSCFLVLAAVLFSVNFLLGKVLVGQVPPFTLSVLRWGVVAAVLYPLVGRGRRLPPAGRWAVFWLLGATGVLANSVIYLALARTSAVSAGIVNAATPAAAFFLAWPLAGERPTALRFGGIMLSLGGVAVLLLPPGAGWHPNAGDLLMLINVVGWSLYTILGRWLMHRTGVSPQGLLLWTATAGIVELLPLSAGELYADRVHLGLLQGVQVLAIGLFATAAAFWAWFQGTAVVGASRATAYMNLTPVVTAGVAVLFLGERVQSAQAVGGVLILAGVYLAARSSGAKLGGP